MDFSLFVGVMVLPVWRRPPRSPQEVQERADLVAEFIGVSKQMAVELKKGIMKRMQHKQEGDIDE